jgi:hypothetical protein
MVQPVHLRRLGETVIRLVEDQRVIFPRIPVAEHDLHKLVGPVVARVVLHVLSTAEIPSLPAVERGHDVPGSATL